MIPIIPQEANNWLQSPSATAALGSFPFNLTQFLPEDTQKEILRYIYENYSWPQILERMPFEGMWDTILQMYRIKMNKIDLSIEEASQAGRAQKPDKDESNSGAQVRVADSVVFDAVERLTDIQHFVSFKDGIPVQYNIPKYFDSRSEDSFYHPFRDKIKSANALLQWNFDNEDVYRKHAIISRHFYTYGVAFSLSEFQFLIKMIMRQYNNGQSQMIPEILRIGTTFDPISIRRLWLNFRMNAYDLDYQPCPFWFTETPRFAIRQNVYDPKTNPFGFVNVDKIGQGTSISWLYTEPETQSLRKAIEAVVSLQSQAMGTPLTLPNIMKAEFSADALWTYYPMLPLDPQTLEWKVRKDGVTPVPYFRYVVNSFGHNLAGKQVLLRIQRNFYPRDEIPLYGTSHMPDMDSGVYTPSLGYLLWNHYREIVTCKNQFIVNKDWINNPPAWVLASSPAVNQDLTTPGKKVEVNGPNDFGWRTPYDATMSTVQMMQTLREQAKTSSKSDDALMGKALGGRTSATEANNAFQASMSAVTTPINLFNYDIMGGFAMRVWDYTATWFPPDLLNKITGQMGFALSPEDLWTRVGLKWDIGSTFIESIVRQQNIRYMLESSMGDPTINRAPMWRELLEEWRFDTAAEWVNDGGMEREVWVATQQSIKTFYGQFAPINPDQNHQIAIKVKTRFLEDMDSPFMTNPDTRVNAPKLMQQIQIHQNFLMMQMHMQMLQQQAAMHGGPPPQGMPEPPGAAGLSDRKPPLSAPNMVATPGQFAQQGGAALA